jgi:hypothetical protein
MKDRIIEFLIERFERLIIRIIGDIAERRWYNYDADVQLYGANREHRNQWGTIKEAAFELKNLRR